MPERRQNVMRVINMTETVVWTSQYDWHDSSAYKAEGRVVIDTRFGRNVGALSDFIRRRPDTIVVVTREVAATIDPDLYEKVRVPGQAEMAGGGYYAEPYNPHAVEHCLASSLA